MHDELLILERLIEGTDADRASRSSRTESTTPAVDTSQGNTSPSTTHLGSIMISSRPSQDGKEHMKQVNSTICKRNPKCLYSYINERRIVRDKVYFAKLSVVI